jgi:serine/threonine protein kinase
MTQDTCDPRILDLVVEWEQQYEHGTPVTPDDLCRQCPELLEEVRRRVQQLHAVNRQIGETSIETPQLDDFPTLVPTGAGEGGAGWTGRAAAGRYRPIRFHARGGLGEVHKAHDEELNREVALKRIQAKHADDAESRRRFLVEAEITARLEHPGIVPVYGLVHDENGQPHYAMRFIEGESLADAITRFHTSNGGKPSFDSLDFRQLLQRFISVCNTIAYAHNRDVIHRDLKPANIMLGKYGETLVVDWGLAKSVKGWGHDSAGAVGESKQALTPVPFDAHTQMGQAVGTPAYMSPEQALGAQDIVGPRSDIYSLGATLYTVLAGHAPIRGLSLPELQKLIGKGEFPKPLPVRREVPRALEAICLKAMAPKPGDRYAGATDLAQDLEKWLADEVVPAYREPWTVRQRRWLRRHQTLTRSIASALVVGLAAAIVGVILLTTKNEELQEALHRADTMLNVLEVGLDVPTPAATSNPDLGPGLQEALGRLRNDTTLKPEERARILHTIGITYLSLARPKEAVPVLTDAWTLRKEALGAGDSVALSSAHALATAYLDAGRAAEARVLYAETLEARRHLLGPEHPDTLTSMAGLARALLVAGGSKGEAVALLEQTLRSREAILDPGHPDILTTMNDLGMAYHEVGRNKDAIPLLEKALKLHETKFGRGHHATLNALNNLALLYQEEGRTDEALAHLRAALEIKKTALGLQHPDTLRTMANLGAACRRAGRYPDAAVVLEECVRLMRIILGPDHTDTLTCLNHLAVSYSELGRLTDAVPLLEEAVKLAKKKPGAIEFDTLQSMNNLATSIAEGSRPADAVPLLEKLMELIRAQPSSDQDLAITLTVKNNLASAYYKSGRSADALPLMEEVFRIRKSKFGVDNDETLLSMNNLAAVYKEANRLDEALAMQEETLKLMKAKHGPDNRDTLVATQNLGAAYWAANRRAEALRHFESALQSMKVLYGPKHQNTLACAYNLATTYAKAGRTTEAIRHFEELVETAKGALSPAHPTTQAAMHNLAFTYHQAGRRREAVQLYGETAQLMKARLGAAHAQVITTKLDLAGVYLELREFAAAETVLLEVQKTIQGNQQNVPRRLQEGSVEDLVHLYDAWGQSAKAEDWLGKLPTNARVRVSLNRHCAWPILWGWPRF